MFLHLNNLQQLNLLFPSTTPKKKIFPISADLCQYLSIVNQYTTPKLKIFPIFADL